VKVNVEPPAPLRDLRPDVPPELEAVILRTLTKDRDARMPSARALAEALAPFSSDVSGSQAQRTVSVPHTRGSVIGPQGADATAPTIQFAVDPEATAPRSRGPLVAAGLALVVLLGAVGWLAFARTERSAPAAASASTESTAARAEADAAPSHAVPGPTAPAATQAPTGGSAAAPSPAPTVTAARPTSTSSAAATTGTSATLPTPASPSAAVRAPVPPVAAPMTTPSPGGAPLGI
jgi:serine/threonine-protein kinase